MTGHPRDSNEPMSFMELVDHESIEELEKGWKRLIEDKVPWTGELVRLQYQSSSVGSFGQMDRDAFRPMLFRPMFTNSIIHSILEIEEALVRPSDRQKTQLLDIGSLSTRVFK